MAVVQELLPPFITASAGLGLLLFSANYLVVGAVSLARRLGWSKLIIGLTVIAFGTSAPEFVTVLAAALEEAPAMAVGNVVGSNLANMLLILGVAAAIRPIACAPRVVKRDGVAVLLATVLFIALGFAQGLTSLHAIILLVVWLAYLTWSYYAERNLANQGGAVHVMGAEEVTGVPPQLWVAGLMVSGGLVGLVVGAELLVRGGIQIARLAGVSEAAIGLTLIAVGTSLPELATVAVASWRAHGDVVIGNILGSNIFNLLAVAGGVASITPLPVPKQILFFDVWAMLAVTALMLPIMITGHRVSRPEGGGLLVLYGGYVFVQFSPIREILGFTSV